MLLGMSQRTGTGFDITFVPIGSAQREVRDLVHTQFSENNARFSPDGRWVVYSSDESGRAEIYVVDFPNAARKWQVSRDGGGGTQRGAGAVWSLDGREIFFRQPQGAMMAAPVTHVGDTIEIGAPTKLGLSDAPVSGPFGSDGKRFLVTQVDPAAGNVPIELIRNWSGLLARRNR